MSDKEQKEQGPQGPAGGGTGGGRNPPTDDGGKKGAD